MNCEDAKTQSCMDEYLGKKSEKTCPKCGKVVTKDGCGCKKGAATKDCGTSTVDAWEESKHKRASDGKFTSGGAGAASIAKNDVRLMFFRGLGKWGVEPNLPMFPHDKDGKFDAKQQKENLARLENERKLFDSKEAAEAYVKGLSAKPKVDSDTLKKGVVGMPKEQASKIIGDYVQRKVKGVERFRDESAWNRGFFSFELEFPKLSGKELSDKKGEIAKAFSEFFPADALRMNTKYGGEPIRLIQFLDYTRLSVSVPSLRELRNDAESAKKASESYDRIAAKLDEANEKGVKVSFAWNQEPKFSDKKLENDADRFEQLRQTYTFKANGMNAKIREMESKSVLSVVEKAYKGGEEGKAAVDAWNKSHTRKDENGIYALDEAETEAGATFDAAEDVTTVPMDVAAFDEYEAKKAMEHFAKLEPIAEKKEGTCACKLKKLIAKAEKDGDKKRKDAYVHLLADANDAKIAEAQYVQKSDKDLKTLLESYKSNVASSAEWAAWAKKNGKPDNMTQEQFDAFTIRQKDYGEQMGLHVKAIERVLAKRKKDGVDIGDAWEESKHPRNHGKFAKKGNEGVISVGDIIAYIGKTVEGDKYNPLGVVVRIDESNGKKFYTADFHGHLGIVPESDIRSATKSESESEHDYLTKLSEYVKSGKYHKKHHAKTAEDKSKLSSVKKFDDKKAEGIMAILRSSGLKTKFGARVTMNKYKRTLIGSHGEAAWNAVMKELLDDGKKEITAK